MGGRGMINVTATKEYIMLEIVDKDVIDTYCLSPKEVRELAQKLKGALFEHHILAKGE